MKRAFQIKHKLKLALLLVIILILVLLCNLSLRQSFNKLDLSITSLYKDRLLPATYIFKMTDQWYKKQMLVIDGKKNISDIENSIDSLNYLLKEFSKTWLTVDEKELFDKLDTLIQNTTLLEQEWLLKAAVNNEIPKSLTQNYKEGLYLLDALSIVQIKEGGDLHTGSRKEIAGTKVESQFEITLLIILGVASIALITIREKLIPDERTKEWLN